MADGDSAVSRRVGTSDQDYLEALMGGRATPATRAERVLIAELRRLREQPDIVQLTSKMLENLDAWAPAAFETKSLMDKLSRVGAKAGEIDAWCDDHPDHVSYGAFRGVADDLKRIVRGS